MTDEPTPSDLERKLSITASQPKEISAVLNGVIERVSNDPAELRQLVYALARRKLQPEAPAGPDEVPAWLSKAEPDELRALALELAIQNVENHSARPKRDAGIAASETSPVPDDSDDSMASNPATSADEALFNSTPTEPSPNTPPAVAPESEPNLVSEHS